MDPVTGLSRRALRILGLIVVLGVVAATAATVGRASPGCPDERYGCATSHPGEPVIVGLLITEGTAGEALAEGVRAAITDREARLLGRPLHPVTWRMPCTARGGAHGARQLASDPLDAAPVFAVIAAACPRALVPAAQILADSGIVLVSAAAPGPLPHNARTTLDGSSIVATEGYAALGSMVLDAAEALAVEREGEVLIPRTPLRRALVVAGLDPAPAGGPVADEQPST